MFSKMNYVTNLKIMMKSILTFLMVANKLSLVEANFCLLFSHTLSCQFNQVNGFNYSPCFIFFLFIFFFCFLIFSTMISLSRAFCYIISKYSLDVICCSQLTILSLMSSLLAYEEMTINLQSIMPQKFDL